MTLVFEHLVGREFVWGAADCFELGRDFFRDNFTIAIRNYARPTNWASDNIDLIRLCYEQEGFKKITDWRSSDLRPADVLCIAMREANPNHFSIFLGENKIIHHLYGRRSTVEPYKDFWRNSTAFVLRHPDVPDLRPVHPETSIQELLRARSQLVS